MDVATRPPVARVQLVRETRFGVTLDDPYRWMEDPDDPDVDRWLDGQAAYSRSVLAALPHRRSLLERIGSLSGDREILSEFTLAGDRVFHLHRGIGAAVSALVVRDGDTSRVLLDPSATPGQEHSVIDWYVPSPDGRYVACAVSQGGSTDATVCVVDVDRAALLGDAVKVGDGFFNWLPDCRTFVYHRYREAAADVSADRLRDDSRSCLHRLGDDPERDVAVLGRGLNPLVTIAARDRPYLVVPPGDDWVIALITHSATGERVPEQLPDNTIYVALRRGAIRSGRLRLDSRRRPRRRSHRVRRQREHAVPGLSPRRAARAGARRTVRRSRPVPRPAARARQRPGHRRGRRRRGTSARARPRRRHRPATAGAADRRPASRRRPARRGQHRGMGGASGPPAACCSYSPRGRNPHGPTASTCPPRR